MVTEPRYARAFHLTPLVLVCFVIVAAFAAHAGAVSRQGLVVVTDKPDAMPKNAREIAVVGADFETETGQIVP